MKRLIIIGLFITGILISNIDTPTIKEDEEIKAVFLSYIEINDYIKNTNQEISKSNIRKIINNIKSMNLNTIILQVRAASDAIYDSKIFPKSLYLVNNEQASYYDVLAYFIKEAHKYNVKVIAWINPYRVRTTNNINTITENNPAYKYLNTDTIYIENGVYFNPSKKEVTDLIVRGVEEVLEYKVDGILFDDYFYPNTNIDEKDYQEYIKNNDYVSPENYRLDIINNMIKKVYKKCKEKNIPFGISPDGNIENNYNSHYADIKTWLKSDEYIDFIMPQIYYGFYNSSRDYVNTLKEWESYIINNNIDLYVALAFYKVGQYDKYARDGSNEWLMNDDIIMREILLSRNAKNYKGFSLFRYNNIFNKDTFTNNTVKEIENLKKIIK
ncbi:MAG: family 10 glycosylhydrolase [Bacilli bacterium]|nr:family 10 glycosylhydrolase [Bacilli bacterium]